MSNGINLNGTTQGSIVIQEKLSSRACTLLKSKVWSVCISPCLNWGLNYCRVVLCTPNCWAFLERCWFPSVIIGLRTQVEGSGHFAQDPYCLEGKGSKAVENNNSGAANQAVLSSGRILELCTNTVQSKCSSRIGEFVRFWGTFYRPESPLMNPAPDACHLSPSVLLAHLLCLSLQGNPRKTVSGSL